MSTTTIKVPGLDEDQVNEMAKKCNASEQLLEMFAALPSSGSNPVGKVARAALENQIKGATPGKHSQPWPQKSGPSFRSIFFPKYDKVAYQDDIKDETKLKDGWWADFAVAVICQAIHHIVSDIDLDKKKIDKDVDKRNKTLHEKIAKWYGHVFKHEDTNFHTAYKATSDIKGAKDCYKHCLTSNAWINIKKVQAKNGTWTNAAWEIYHHYIKLSILGASDDEIKDVIKEQQDKGLEVPDAKVAYSSDWRKYDDWMQPNALSRSDIDDEAHEGITANVCTSFPGSNGPSCMDNENSFEFTAHDQPGDKYLDHHSSSCFTKNTQVLMGDGTLKAIKDIKPGEKVSTPHGKAVVALVARPLRYDRTLYSLNDLPFAFTDIHPFPSAANDKAILSIKPERLRKKTPTFAMQGVDKLVSGKALKLFNAGKKTLKIKKIQAHKATDKKEELYDLILLPNEYGTPNHRYIIGTEDTQIVVFSEIPHFEKDPVVATCVMSMFDQAMDDLRATTQKVDKNTYPETIAQAMNYVSSNLVHKTMQAFSFDAQQELQIPEWQDRVKQLMPQFSNGQPYLDWRLGKAWELLLAHHTQELKGMIDLGWRKFSNLPASKLPLMTLTLMDVTSFCPIKNPIKLVVAIKRQSNVLFRFTILEKPTSNQSYIHLFREVVSFTKLSKNLNLVVKGFIEKDEQREKIFSGQMFLTPGIANNYQKRQIRLFDKHEKECGRLLLDIRLTNESLHLMEEKAKKKWHKTNQFQFAEQLGIACGKVLGDELSHILPLL